MSRYGVHPPVKSPTAIACSIPSAFDFASSASRVSSCQMLVSPITRTSPGFEARIAFASGMPVRTHESQKCPKVESEEHTSELQSQSNLVCRLLLEKKK